MMYTPDNWVVLRITLPNKGTHYRILGGWSGGYIGGDSWRLNSGITRVEEKEGKYYFYGSSGSCYVCGKNSYGMRMNNYHVWASLREQYGTQIQLMNEKTGWSAIDWVGEA